MPSQLEKLLWKHYFFQISKLTIDISLYKLYFLVELKVRILVLKTLRTSELLKNICFSHGQKGIINFTLWKAFLINFARPS